MSLVSPLVSRKDLSRGLFLLQGIALQSTEPTLLLNMGTWAYFTYLLTYLFIYLGDKVAQ